MSAPPGPIDPPAPAPASEEAPALRAAAPGPDQRQVFVNRELSLLAFQWRVFEALRDIPRGKTRTYGEIASRVGRPKAARAVGRACATNPVAVAIPCHRAVGAGGGLTGYRWGVERKQALLSAEATSEAAGR